MASNNPDKFRSKLDTILKAWKDKAPTAKFAGMSIAEFEAKVKPAYDARAKVAEGESLMQTGINERGTADAAANKEIELVVASVVGTREFGNDSDLYEQMGYKRKSERKSGLTRKSKAAGGTTV